MESSFEFGPKIIWNWPVLGPITETIIMSWLVTAIIIVLIIVLTRKFDQVPGKLQCFAEFLYESVNNYVTSTLGKGSLTYTAYIGTLMTYILLGSLLGMVGLRPVTADINATLALAVISFLVIHGSAIRKKGFIGFVKHLGSPVPALFPINVISEVAIPVSLAFRLFGNLVGGVIVMTLVHSALVGLGSSISESIPILTFLIPIPANLFFDIFEPLLQTFIFTAITLTFISISVDTSDASH